METQTSKTMITREQLEDEILNRLSEFGFIQIGVIGITDGSWTHYDYGCETSDEDQVPYEDRSSVSSESLWPLNYDSEKRLDKVTSIANIKQALEKGDGVFRNIIELVDIHDREHFLQIDYRWMDKTEQTVFYLLNDVTELRERQLKIELDDLILAKTEETVDFIAVIDMSKQTIELRSGTWFGRHDDASRGQRKILYARYIDQATKYLINSKEAYHFRYTFSLESIASGLDENAEFYITYSFPNNDKSADGIAKKQFRFVWLDKDRRLVLVIRSDVTQALAEEEIRTEELSEALAAAEQANDAKLDFISRISHDIRTPLSAIKSMTEFAYQDIGNPEKLAHDLNRIESSSAFLNSLINDILDVSKIDSGQVQLHFEQYGYSEYIDEFDNIIRTETQKKGISAEIEHRDDAVTFFTDPVRWRQITLNVIMNAITYTHSGGTIKFITGHEPAQNGMTQCYFIVEDTGIGMNEEFLSHVFEPFRQDVENPERRNISGGTGLGLYIIHRLVDMLDGTISIQSKLGEGTRVEVRVPMRIVSPSESATAGEYDDTSNISLHGHVLLAEDNFVNTEIALRILDEIGLTVDHVSDGHEAVDKFAMSKIGFYDLILMDIQMPLMNGYEATEKIRNMSRADARDIPIIALTADAFGSAKRRALAAGFTDYFTKPLNIDKLKRLLANKLYQQ